MAKPAAWNLSALNEEIATALLQHNYFPRIANDATELPPCFTSRDFTPVVARSLLESSPPRLGGYDGTPARVTRFDLISRRLTLPHPRAYAELALFIASNWNQKLSYLSESTTSRLKPKLWPDGRVFSMQEPRARRQRRPVTAALEVRADVDSFYANVYTHAIPWAILGKNEAKADRSTTNWANEFDRLLRQCNRGETSGLQIGPATSAIAGEIILQAVDGRLAAFHFVRYVDDFICFAGTDDAAREFVLELSSALADFSLELNPRKTRITELPQPARPEWVRRLNEFTRTIRPKRWSDVSNLLDMAIELALTDPEASSLRYALKVIESSAKVKKKRMAAELYEGLLQLSASRPIAIPFLCRHLISYKDQIDAEYSETLNELLVYHAQRFRTDAVTWLLFTCLTMSLPISQESAAAVVRQRDCLALTLLSLTPEHRDAVVAVAEDVLSVPADEYERDRYWVLLYELYRRGLIWNVSAIDPAFVELARHDVAFVDLDADVRSVFSLYRAVRYPSFVTY